MRQYPDLTNEEMGIPNLGDPNVTFPDWKVMEELSINVFVFVIQILCLYLYF